MLQRIRWKLLSEHPAGGAGHPGAWLPVDIKITVTPIPFTLIGLPLAIFLGFRNNTT